MAANTVVFVSVCDKAEVRSAVVVNASVVAEGDTEEKSNDLRALGEKLSAALGVILTVSTVSGRFVSWQKFLQDDLPACGHQSSVVAVKHWDSYGSEKDAVMTHTLDVLDQRGDSGQLFADLAVKDGAEDDRISIAMEVNTAPVNNYSKVPCVHVHFNQDALACSLFKVGKDVLIRPEQYVELEAVIVQVNGIKEPMYWLKDTRP